MRYLVRLDEYRLDLEEKREQSLIRQSSQMLTAFAFSTSALFAITPVVFENVQHLVNHMYFLHSVS